jgi:hypothetical protein
MNAQKGKGGMLSLFNLGRWGCGWSTPRPGRFIPRYPLYKKLGEPKALVWMDAENLAHIGIRSPDRRTTRIQVIRVLVESGCCIGWHTVSELVKTRKKIVLMWFKVVSQNCRCGTESPRKIYEGSWSPLRGLKPKRRRNSTKYYNFVLQRSRFGAPETESTVVSFWIRSDLSAIIGAANFLTNCITVKEWPGTFKNDFPLNNPWRILILRACTRMYSELEFERHQVETVWEPVSCIRIFVAFIKTNYSSGFPPSIQRSYSFVRTKKLFSGTWHPRFMEHRELTGEQP